jgi:uncharacterized protein (DUF427 family)
VLAESDSTEKAYEGNFYFPKSSLQMQYFTSIDKTTFCGWKGTANYYDIKVDGKTVSGGAWYYAEPKEKAAHIKVGFGG